MKESLTLLHAQNVPSSSEVRGRIDARIVEEVRRHKDSFTMGRRALEELSRRILDELQYPEHYLPWVMVLLGSEFWKEQIRAVPFSKRILLLPHCMRDTERCPAHYDEVELNCLGCGACALAELKQYAESLGYTVLIAEGTPVVMQSILSGQADAILGVGCLKSLERAFEKLRLVGIPAAAVPLLTSHCKDSQVELDRVRAMIEIPCDAAETRETPLPPSHFAPNWLHLLRGAARFCARENFAKLFPRSGNKATGPGSNLIAMTDEIARDYLDCGGKYFRPFITLAVYDALTGAHGTQSDGPEHIDAFPEPVKRIVVAIEIFHKASLIHDDIEDDDPYRYGRQTLHHTYGIPSAINLGDYLLGLGYRLIALQGKELRQHGIERGGEIVAEILAKLGEAHTKLAEGQGAELFWRRESEKPLSPAEVLTIYALKTSPAFEAALFAGLRLGLGVSGADADQLEKLETPLKKFARYLGIAFQIRNDLDDWSPKEFNKKTAARDVSADRPTILRSLAGETLHGPEREKLYALLQYLRQQETLEENAKAPEEKLTRVLEEIHLLYTQANVFHRAEQLIEKYAARARDAAEAVEHEPLRRFLLHLFEPLTCVSQL